MLLRKLNAGREEEKGKGRRRKNQNKLAETTGKCGMQTARASGHADKVDKGTLHCQHANLVTSVKCCKSQQLAFKERRSEMK